MSKRYKIYPGIGVTRVGKSEYGYFIGPETLGGEPFEISETGDIAFTGYKDASHLIRRQGVRFRVFEYDEDEATGGQTFVREVTPEEAAIHWTVTLGNRKAAGPWMESASGSQGERIIVPGDGQRNRGVPRDRLMTETKSPAISGTNQRLLALRGAIMDQPVLLGEVGTDHRGRLVVLGGFGESASWETPPAEIEDYLNNNGWFDDVSDGSVDAELEFPDGTRQRVHEGSWVVVGPPDFAPNLAPFVSLYDLMYDTLVRASRLEPPARVSFQHDIWPILERAAGLRWVNTVITWGDLAEAIKDRAALADPGDEARPAREIAFGLLMQSEEDLSDFRLTITQHHLLDKWVAGQFESDLDSPLPALTPGEELDRAVLSRCIGSGLFPGIEMGYMTTNPTLYSEFCRFTRGEFDDYDGPRKLEPGMVSQRMALPWQADFIECSRVWWPVQRPDTALFKEDGTGTPPNFRWDRGLVVGSVQTHASHLNMVRHFAKLGLVDRLTVGTEEVMAELGRSPDLGG